MTVESIPSIYVMATLTAYKIGKTTNLRQRYLSGRTMNPDLALVAAVREPAMDVVEGRDYTNTLPRPGVVVSGSSGSVKSKIGFERFRSSPYVARTLNVGDLAQSFPHFVWPWDNTPTVLSEEDGQICLPISSTYVAPIGRGQGQTSSVSEDWYTPTRYVEAAREVFGGTIDLDPMTCPEANLTVRAERIFTAEVDGLKFPWTGNVFLNPPWGTGPDGAKVRAVRKALAEYASGNATALILVLNANAITTAWFAPLLAACDAMAIPNHRVEHRGPGGRGGAPNSGTVFVYLGPDAALFTSMFSRFGAVVATQASGGTELAEDWDDADN